MANIRINSLPATTSVLVDDVLPMDGATTRKIRPADLVDSVRPIASQSQAEAGTNNTTSMTPLATFQAVDAKLPNTAAGRALLAAANPAAQRTALGLGGAAQLSVGTTSGTVAAGDDSRILGAAQKSANLSDLASASTARTNLGLGNSATLNVGSSAGTVAAGDDIRFAGVAGIVDQATAEAGTNNAGIMSPLRTAQYVGFNIGITRAEISTRSIPVNAFIVTGESTNGDGGAGALYVRGTSGGMRAVQDAAGTWWNLSLAGASHIVSGWLGTGVAGIQDAINTASVSGLKSVFVSPGIYTLTTVPLYLQAGVTLWANKRTVTITQANGANLSALIDFSVNGATAAECLGLVIDGNRSGNTNDTTDKFAFYVDTVADTVIRNCEIRNFAGHGVYISSGLRPVIVDNHIHDLNLYAVYINCPTVGPINMPLIVGNRIDLCSWHAIVVIRSTDAVIAGNSIYGLRISGVVVNVSGTTVTWVSGPNFADVTPGNFIIYNGGIEALVTAKASNTSLTINYAAGNGTNLPAALGCADVISSVSSSNTRIANNIVRGGASLGISVFSDMFGMAANDVGSIVEDNIVTGLGSAGYSVQASSGGETIDAMFRGNQAIECGLNTTASSPEFNSGMTVGGGVVNVVVESNAWISYGSAMSGLRLTTPTVGQVRTADNRSKTDSESIVGGATASVSAGWGTDATVTVNEVVDDCLRLTVVSGSGASANPRIYISHKCLPVRRKMPTAQMISTDGTFMPIGTILPDGAGTTELVLIGTPGSGTTYLITVKL